MNSNWIPLTHVSSRVSEATRQWWQDIGRSLMAFTEVEQLVLDWSVNLTSNREWWKAHATADLKKRVPLLRKALQHVGEHVLPPEIATRIAAVLQELEALTDLRNDLAHMRLIFGHVPLDCGDGEGDEWIPHASHVETVARREDGQPLKECHDRDWIRSVAEKALMVARELQVLMPEVRELQRQRVESKEP